MKTNLQHPPALKTVEELYTDEAFIKRLFTEFGIKRTDFLLTYEEAIYYRKLISGTGAATIELTDFTEIDFDTACTF